MSNHLRVGIRVGSVGFVAGLFMLFASMGLPLGNLLLAIPIGIITARALSRRVSPEPISQKQSLQAGLLSGILSSLGILLPLLVFALTAPQGATLRAELQKWINPSLIPEFINDLPTALVLGGIVSGLIATGLTVGSCLFTTRYFNQRLSLPKNF